MEKTNDAKPNFLTGLTRGVTLKLLRREDGGYMFTCLFVDVFLDVLANKTDDSPSCIEGIVHIEKDKTSLKAKECTCCLIVYGILDRLGCSKEIDLHYVLKEMLLKAVIEKHIGVELIAYK